MNAIDISNGRISIETRENFIRIETIGH